MRRLPSNFKSKSAEAIPKKILCLGYSENETKILTKLLERGAHVWHSSDKVSELDDFDIIISYGYKYILNKALLERVKAPIINLHISYLPYNRGAHPNFWAFYDGTTSGVTIHFIDNGVDTGEILYQKEIHFDRGEKTFRETYWRLREEVENLFIENLESIMGKKYKSYPQTGKGSFHCLKDLPRHFLGWDSVINDEVERLKRLAHDG